MKEFNQLTKKELSELSELQVMAYIDIELAKQGLVKTVDVQVEYPNYIKPLNSYPERDVVLWEVDGYKFLNLETAQRFSAFLGTLQQVETTYDWNVDSNCYYITGSKFNQPPVTSNKYYSEAKFQAIKPQLKALKEENKKESEKQNNEVESAIDYAKIDEVKEQIRNVVRNAIYFFQKAQSIANDYDKYFSVTNEKDTAIKTLFTVYNVQDEELKEQVKVIIDRDIASKDLPF